MNSLSAKLIELLRGLLRLALGALFGWIIAFIEIWKRMCRGRNSTPPAQPCMTIPADVYKRPDPMIYDQYELLANGVAVTWDNPDIKLYRGDKEVAALDVVAGEHYRIVARCWNGSFDGAAVGLRVRFSYLSFGVATKSNEIGISKTDLGAKGTPSCPAFAEIEWDAPTEDGHYCLQAELLWEDDLNPGNNLGQKNLTVSHFQSPALFSFRLRNDVTWRRRFEMTADGYVIAPLDPCKSADPGAFQRDRRLKRSYAAQRREALALLAMRQGRDKFPISDGWSVVILPSVVQLEPDEEISVTVKLTPPDGLPHPRKTINVNAFADGRLVGGVTLTGEG